MPALELTVDLSRAPSATHFHTISAAVGRRVGTDDHHLSAGLRCRGGPDRQG